MNYMPFKDEQQPIYADEHENIIFRVADIKKLIEDATQLPVTRLVSMGSNSNPTKLRELYGNLNPERIWFVQAIFQTPEGVKTAEVLVMLKDRQLSLPHRIFLHLEKFLAANRDQAKQGIPDLTLDYIQTLESIVSDTWRFWRDLTYLMDQFHADMFVKEMLKPSVKDQMEGLYKALQTVNFLMMHDREQDPFPGGNFDFIERRDKKQQTGE